MDLIPESYAVPLDPRKLFIRSAPVHVDLGCGDGSFLWQLAAGIPQYNFLGIERLLHRASSATRKAAKFDNMRILRAETTFVVHNLLPAGSVEAFYLLFPDPWPKRRHHRRRIVSENFLIALWKALAEGGALHIATDHRNYFDRISQLVAESRRFLTLSPNGSLPISSFERKFRNCGAKIYRLELRKVSPVR